MRAFIAVELSEEVRRKLQQLQRELGFEGVKLVEPENVHITLFFLGEIDDRTTSAVIAAMEKISEKRFELRCKGVGIFPSPGFIRVVWAGTEGEELKRVHSQLAPELRRLGFRIEQFASHATVARVKDPRAKDKIRGVLEQFRDADFGSCLIEKVALKKSTLTPKGPVYETIFEKTLG